MVRTRFTWLDGVAVLAVLLAGVLLLWQPWNAKDSGTVLVVTTPEESLTYLLSEDRTFTITSKGVALQVEISEGSVRVTDSSCPDRVCVSSGRISHAGEVVLCAPAGVTFTVKGGGADVDFVAG